LPEVVDKEDLEAGDREVDHRVPAQGLKAANEAAGEQEQGRQAAQSAKPDREILEFKTTKRCTT